MTTFRGSRTATTVLLTETKVGGASSAEKVSSRVRKEVTGPTVQSDKLAKEGQMMGLCLFKIKGCRQQYCSHTFNDSVPCTHFLGTLYHLDNFEALTVPLPDQRIPSNSLGKLAWLCPEGTPVAVLV